MKNVDVRRAPVEQHPGDSWASDRPLATSPRAPPGVSEVLLVVDKGSASWTAASPLRRCPGLASPRFQQEILRLGLRGANSARGAGPSASSRARSRASS